MSTSTPDRPRAAFEHRAWRTQAGPRWCQRAVLSLAALACSAATSAGPRQACEYSAGLQGVSCVVMVDGRVVHEKYRRPADATERWRLASGTKSFSGVAAAAAVQDRLLTLDERVSDTLAEWRGDDRRDITIRQLLSLTSGIDTPALGSGRRLSPDDAVALRLAHAPPGSHYAYGQAPFQVFAAVMTRKLQREGTSAGGTDSGADSGADSGTDSRTGSRPASGKDGGQDSGTDSYRAYLRRRVLDPLGVTLDLEPAGAFGRGGINWGGGGAMSARDWARFGEFVRQGGVWNARPLVDAAALAENFKGSATHPGYGLTWWLKPPRGAAVPLEGTTENATDFYRGGADALPITQVWMAAGAGKQRLLILPERRMVVVRQTNRLLLGEKSGFSDVEFLRLLLD